MIKKKRKEKHQQKAKKMEAEELLRAADVRLRSRDYAGSRSCAVEAMQLNPSIVGAEQVIAICDVFLAVESSCLGTSPNWYSILKLEPFTEDDDLIVEQFKNFIILLKPSRNLYSHACEAYNLVREAFRVLSNEEKKKVFDEELMEKCSDGVEEEVEDIEVEEVKKGFYTMCPFCYWLFEYENVYKDCCLRCQNCRKGFHGLEIQWPPPMEAGEDSKNSYVAFMPLGVRVDEKRKDGGCVNGTGVNYVEISDDEADDEELKRKHVVRSGNGAGVCDFKSGGMAGAAQGSENVVKSNGKGKGGRRKTVASNTKKVMGRGIPRSQLEPFFESVDRKKGDTGEGSSAFGGNVASSSGVVADGVEFMDQDDDLMVCLEDL